MRQRRRAAGLAALPLLALGAAAEAPEVPPPAAARPAARVLLFDGLGFESVNDMATDASGCLYLAGETESPDFPTSEGAYDTRFESRGRNARDAFVMKLAPDGTLLWSTLLGGPGHDRARALALLPGGDVVVAGGAGPDFPVTPGAFQTRFAGGKDDLDRGPQDGFVCRLRADGAALVFCSYFGSQDASIVNDVATDADGRILVASSHATGALPAEWFEGRLAPVRRRGRDGLVAAIAGDGHAVLWATHLGGAGDDEAVSVAAGPDASVYVLTASEGSPELPVSAGAAGPRPGGHRDLHLARLAPDGRSLVFGTWLGGRGDELAGAGSLAVASDGSAFVAGTTTSKELPTTPGSAQPAYHGGGLFRSGEGTEAAGDGFVAHLAPDGRSLLAATFLGGRLGDGITALALDPTGEVLVVGSSFSPDFPTTSDAPVAPGAGSVAGTPEAFVAELSPDLGRLRFSSLWGGEGADEGWVVGGSGARGIWSGGLTRSRELGPHRRLFGTAAVALVEFPPPPPRSTPPAAPEAGAARPGARPGGGGAGG